MLGFPGSSFSGADVEFMLIPSGGSVLVYFPTLPGSVLDLSCLYASELSVCPLEPWERRDRNAR